MTVDISLCICTFRRAHILDTLRSISELNMKPEWKLGIIVADNDETPSAEKYITAIGQATRFSLTYVHAPARNISIARNACLDNAQTDLMAFIDDDELLTADWLVAMMAEMEKTHADVVLGPVIATYMDDCPGWLRAGDFHSTKPVWVGENITTGYAGNVLLRKDSSAVKNLRFKESLGRTGGEDTEFFNTVYKAGGKIVYAKDAVATESIPQERLNLVWLLKRRFRAGQTHGMILLENGETAIRNILAAASKAIFCFAATLLNILRPVPWRFWLLRSALHAGVVSRLLGKREIAQYG